MTTQVSSTWASEPIVVCTYGPSGIGKTTDMGYSFPTALFLAAPGALNSIVSVCGYNPDREPVTTIMEVITVLDRMGKSKKHDTLVVDDFSFVAEQTFAELEVKHSGFKLWGKMRDVALEFRDKSRYAGVNVIINCWEQPPKTKEDGSRVRGGPQLSGKLPEQIPALCDVVLRAVHEPQRKPWPASYRCGPDPGYVMKDRFNIASVADPAPMNLGELLRASGLRINRRPDYPEQDEQVEMIAQGMSGDTRADAEMANAVFRKLIENGQSVYNARWTLRDAMDRSVIRKAVKAQSLRFFEPNNRL